MKKKSFELGFEVREGGEILHAGRKRSVRAMELKEDRMSPAVSCGDRPAASNTEASATSGNVGDVVTYTCDAGYSQSGGGTGRRTCSSQGSWEMSGQDSDPICEGNLKTETGI